MKKTIKKSVPKKANPKKGTTANKNLSSATGTTEASNKSNNATQKPAPKTIAKPQQKSSTQKPSAQKPTVKKPTIQKSNTQKSNATGITNSAGTKGMFGAMLNSMEQIAKNANPAIQPKLNSSVILNSNTSALPGNQIAKQTIGQSSNNQQVLHKPSEIEAMIHKESLSMQTINSFVNIFSKHSDQQANKTANKITENKASPSAQPQANTQSQANISDKKEPAIKVAIDEKNIQKQNTVLDAQIALFNKKQNNAAQAQPTQEQKPKTITPEQKAAGQKPTEQKTIATDSETKTSEAVEKNTIQIEKPPSTSSVLKQANDELEQVRDTLSLDSNSNSKKAPIVTATNAQDISPDQNFTEEHYQQLKEDFERFNLQLKQEIISSNENLIQKVITENSTLKNEVLYVNEQLKQAVQNIDEQFKLEVNILNDRIMQEFHHVNIQLKQEVQSVNEQLKLEVLTVNKQLKEQSQNQVQSDTITVSTHQNKQKNKNNESAVDKVLTGVGHIIVGSVTGVLSIPKYTVIGLIEGVKDSKNLVVNTISK